MSTIVGILLETEETRPISSEQGLEEGTCYQQPTWAASPKQRD